MTSISDLAERLGKEAESIKLYFSAVESRVALRTSADGTTRIGSSLDETIRILKEKMRTFNLGFEELTEMVKNESED